MEGFADDTGQEVNCTLDRSPPSQGRGTSMLLSLSSHLTTIYREIVDNGNLLILPHNARLALMTWIISLQWEKKYEYISICERDP